MPRDQVVVVLVDDSRQKDKDSILIQSLTSIHAKLNRDKHSPCEMVCPLLLTCLPDHLMLVAVLLLYAHAEYTGPVSLPPL